MEIVKPAPKDPTPDESVLLVNSSDKKRREFWSDAAASLGRRVSALEGTFLSSAWTVPVILSLTVALTALALGVYSVLRLLRRGTL